MNASRRAVIDIGTNSVKLLVADVCDSAFEPLLEKSEQTRLGSGFFETRCLQAEAIERTSAAVLKYANQARERGAGHVRIVATSAARDASNQSELCDAVFRATGLSLEVISGEAEARWAYLGVATDPSLRDKPLLVMDIGGGSTEFVIGRGGQKFFQGSFPLGSVRLMERMNVSDPPAPHEWEKTRAGILSFLREEVAPRLRPALAELGAQQAILVGVGGTPSILAAMKLDLEKFDRSAIEGVKITFPELSYQLGQLWALPLAERKKIKGLPPERADVIIMGAAIVALVMEEFGLKVLRPSTRGIRFAALTDDE
jgi:exopolyphosphatase/guanosine-5'-triphosphate,3'-diphosphate pyrophosphatase